MSGLPTPTVAGLTSLASWTAPPGSSDFAVDDLVEFFVEDLRLLLFGLGRGQLGGGGGPPLLSQVLSPMWW